MKVLASLRVKPISPSLRPEPALVDRAAAVVQRHGFEVLRKGRRSLTVSGDQSDFEQLVGKQLHPGSFIIEQDTAGTEMAAAVDLLEITDAPAELSREYGTNS